jgi:ATP-dependent DNA helicase RecQ
MTLEVFTTVRKGRYKRLDLNSLDVDSPSRLPKLLELVNAVDSRFIQLEKDRRIHRWQAIVAAELLNGNDVVVKSQTGSGKSLCYLSLAIHNPESCLLVICPLLSLMKDQVASAEEHGIRAVALCAESIEKDPRLIQKVRSGQYTMVFVSAEFTAPGNESWKQLVSQNRYGRSESRTFSSRLEYLVIDEAHLIREW